MTQKLKIGRALISVSDKTGLVEFARGLAALGIEIISTGGTARALTDAGLKVTPVSEITGFPEILDGRVKTLHPAIYGGILARRIPEHLEQIEKQGIAPIDLVVVNLYPFQETVSRKDATFAEAIENIDIGGPSMLRAAAKNHESVAVVVRPQRYGEILDQLEKTGEISADFRFKLAVEAFAHTAEYDRAITAYLQEKAAECQIESKSFPDRYSLDGLKVMDLRYGENPHQRAAFYRSPGPAFGIAGGRILQGKELSYNNIVDAEAALRLVSEFTAPAAVIVKHTNPCGVAVSTDLVGAYRTAFAADPVSAFGGIVALNGVLDASTAAEMVKTFLEVVVVPGCEPEALEILRTKPGLRVLVVHQEAARDLPVIKTVSGGFLVQEPDRETLVPAQLRTVTRRAPTEAEMADLQFAFTVVKHVKSNAIVVAANGRTLGIGAGQMNRVGAAEIALKQAGENCRGAVLASDAFFPFRDTVDAAAASGISAIIQPGGSNRDEESIAAADEHGLAMVFTGIRHFQH